ncbi:hypothetical protein CEUSTIGMA_g12046.t1 [Chlamydomonas eustigma]|uniref:inosine/xanthosine triphosphatase n=1 Tax=Chlamydomonas eustigma TaxID=1157962 RepID=A0A250XNF7_9CHLO|nr:hypothetical protein CEUSTIGMA_g12046.t1 [Chlamydomonas eustigma]|eukprot:GAX84625.1 hypothetical protein CEUSTIGMA_g12046.t1 [Chlamydomonas eustigma]
MLHSKKLVYVASQNPVKINATRNALKLCFPDLTPNISGFPVDSGVPAQPFGDDETLKGACIRLNNLRSEVLYMWGELPALERSTAPELYLPPTACNGLLVAIEGGVGLRQHHPSTGCGNDLLECFAWIAVGCTETGVLSTVRTGSFVLPDAMKELVEGGMELGAADDALYGKRMSTHSSGTVGMRSQLLVNSLLQTIDFTNFYGSRLGSSHKTL